MLLLFFFFSLGQYNARTYNPAHLSSYTVILSCVNQVYRRLINISDFFRIYILNFNVYQTNGFLLLYLFIYKMHSHISGIIIITDGVFNLDNMNLEDALLAQVRITSATCSFLQVGNGYQSPSTA